MNDKVITLPSADEMIARLMKVQDDELAQSLYRNVAQRAGEEKVAAGIIMMFSLGIYDVCQGYPPMMQNLLSYNIPAWVDALVDDKEVADAAKAFWKEATSKK
ncbi:MAG: hypothetical protein DPW11_02995 [bacterium]|nr:hypothetical protein [bacterium]RIK51858.1 MAG: hypothetical protein DCC61_01395 [Candidatus Microgenomates bacterium]